MGRVEVDKLYSDHNHTYQPGAEFIASSVVSGLKAFQDSPFLSLLSEKGKAVQTAAAKYVSPSDSIQISDVPLNTQMGSPPAPDGAPGNGRYFPPTPAHPTLPTLWIIGDSTVRNGTLGTLRKVVVEYPQGWLSTRLEASGQKQAGWRTDPKRSGVAGCFGDIATHAFNLARYVSGLLPESISAHLRIFEKGRALDDYGTAMIRYQNGALGTDHGHNIARMEQQCIQTLVCSL